MHLSEEDPENWPPRIRCSDACDPSTLDTNNTVPGDTGCCGAAAGRAGSLRASWGGMSLGDVAWGSQGCWKVPGAPGDAEGCARGSQRCWVFPGVPVCPQGC